MESKRVLVPRSDLKKIREARLLLFEILNGDDEKIAKITNGVSNVMYEIGNKKYPPFEPQYR